MTLITTYILTIIYFLFLNLLDTDSINYLRKEVITVNGTASQKRSSRYGDYFSMSVEQTTFWQSGSYVNDYGQATIISSFEVKNLSL